MGLLKVLNLELGCTLISVLLEMESQAVYRKLKLQAKNLQDVPGLIIKLQATGLLGQLEKALAYAFESADNPDEDFKARLKIILDQVIDSTFESQI